MRKLSTLFVVLFLGFNVTHIFAQKKTKRKEVIVVRFLIPKRNYINKIEIPVNNNSKGNLDVGQGSVDECGVPEKCKGSNYSTYTLSAKAFKTGKIAAKVNFNIEVTDGCKTRKTFVIYRKQRAKLRLNCGVSLDALYGFESEKGN